MGILGGLSEAEARIVELEAELAQAAEVLAAADHFIADSEAAGGPPLDACTACYWTLRAKIIAWRAATGGTDA